MRTLHFCLRVADLDRSLEFYTAIGYEVVGTGLSHFVVKVESMDATIAELSGPTEFVGPSAQP